MPNRAAVWDLGSSSFHVLVCELSETGDLVPVLRRRAKLDLGASVGSTGSISAERARAAVAACTRLRFLVDTVSPDTEIALATAALRDASNGTELVGRIQRAIRTPVEVLLGEDEARLCWRGQRESVWMGEEPSLGLDLGGGSLELAVGNSSGILGASSIPIGATRLRGELGSKEPLGRAGIAKVHQRVKQELASVSDMIDEKSPDTSRAVVSGGTARALARLAVSHSNRIGHSHVERVRKGTAKPTQRHVGTNDTALTVNQVELPAGQLRRLAQGLGELDLSQRLALPSMSTRRAPSLALGAAVLDAVATELRIERFVISEWGLREGALLEALDQL